MDFQIKKTLSNTRPPKSTEKLLTTSPTPGTLKLSEEGAVMLGVKRGDYVGCVQGSDDKFYLYKGSEGTDGASNDGSKVATANERDSGTMNFSSANVYNSLGGNKQSTNIYTIEEGVEHGGKTYFALTLKETREKQERKKGASADTAVSES